MLGNDRMVSNVIQQETSRSVRVLRLPTLETALPYQSRLLVAQDAADGHAPQSPSIRHNAIHL
jgi:hypothetical protein